MKDKWLEFLRQWHDSIPAGIFPRDAEQDTVVDSYVPDWMESNGAKDDQIAEAERRLGISLSPTYRAFLQASNGLVVPGNILPRLLAVEEIDWLHVLDPELISAWKLGMALYGPETPVPDEEYFVYGEGQDPSSLRPEYLEAALQISDKESTDTAIFLLNPQVTDEDGEWEAWSFAHWKAGADRYRSFWDLMQAEYRSFLSVVEQEAKCLQPGDDSQMLVVKLPNLTGELHKKADLWRKMVEQRNERRNPWEFAYHQGILEGLQYAEIRVREICAGKTSPENLYAQLKALEDELQAKWQDGIKIVRKPNVRGLFFGGGIQTVQLSGTAEGYREAWGIIRWFLNEG